MTTDWPVNAGINRHGVANERVVQERSSNHPDPEPCEAARKDALEALARGICRLGIPNLRAPKSSNPGADGVMTTGRQQDGARYCERAVARRSQRPQACIETGRPAQRAPRPAAPGRRAGGRWEKAMSYKTHMYGGGESYSGIVPTKQPNEGRGRPQEAVEGRPLTKENMEEPNSCRTQSRESEPNGLDRVREAARKDGKLQFTALLHHVNADLLRSSYHSLKRQAAAGVDGMTWEEYGQDLEARLADLHGRIHRGAYRAQPSRRVWGPEGAPKADGRQRPLGIAALEDKIVQRAVGTVLNPIWEEDFLGFFLRVSAGAQPAARPLGRDALYAGITRKKVDWVLDLDIRSFFDKISHERFSSSSIGYKTSESSA